jgi:hypothetical protein
VPDRGGPTASDYIETFDNGRRHSSIGMLTPIEYENRHRQPAWPIPTNPARQSGGTSLLLDVLANPDVLARMMEIVDEAIEDQPHSGFETLRFYDPPDTTEGEAT